MLNRINVIGTSGTGKSTFSRQLAAKLGYPYLELDALYWLPDWGEPDDETLFAKLEAALTRQNWVLDGNYKRTVPVKWARVDTVIWLDYSLTRTVFQAVKRAFIRAWSGEELWPGTGNVETFHKAFFSKNSIILWTLKTYRSNRRKYQKVMADPQYSHLRFVHLTSPAAAKQWLESLPDCSGQLFE